MNDNIVQFPRGKRGSPPQSIEEIIETVESVRKEHIEFITDDILSFVFIRASEEGFDLSNSVHAKTTGLMIETIKAALSATVGIDHPLHAVAEQAIKFETVTIPTIDNDDLLEKETSED